MARDENAPFPRGKTWYEGGTVETPDGTPPANIEGKLWTFEDIDYSGTGVKSLRSGRPVVCMAMRNVGSWTALAKYLVKPQSDGTDGKFLLGRFAGMASTTAEGPVYPIDEWLPSSGVPNNDVCWVVVHGPATVRTDLAGAANNVFNVGTVIVALTAATSQATTAGRAAPQDLTGATSVLGLQVMNALGRALSARTTANTNADLLVDFRSWVVE